MSSGGGMQLLGRCVTSLLLFAFGLFVGPTTTRADEPAPAARAMWQSYVTSANDPARVALLANPASLDVLIDLLYDHSATDLAWPAAADERKQLQVVATSLFDQHWPLDQLR